MKEKILKLYSELQSSLNKIDLTWVDYYFFFKRLSSRAKFIDKDWKEEKMNKPSKYIKNGHMYE